MKDFDKSLNVICLESLEGRGGGPGKPADESGSALSADTHSQRRRGSGRDVEHVSELSEWGLPVHDKLPAVGP